MVAVPTVARGVLAIARVGSGSHQLQVRRDVDGNIDPTPAVVKFDILPEPLQSQPWFSFVAALLALLLGWLVWLSFVISARSPPPSVLSQEVAVRRQTEAALERPAAIWNSASRSVPAQLTRSSQQLLHQIAERKRPRRTSAN